MKRDQDDFDIKNAMTSRAFFQKYPKLYDKIAIELEETTKKLDKGIICPEEAGLYPTLVILAKLCPAPFVTGNDEFKVSPYLYSPYLQWIVNFYTKMSTNCHSV